MYEKAIDILLVPDAGSNDREAHLTLNEKGVDILILDHHQYDFLLEPHERTIIINNQNPDSKLNKNLTGVGVVYKFIEAYKEELNIDVDVTKYLRSEEHTSELQSRFDLVCSLLLDKK